MNSLGAWELPEELRLLQQTARRFMETEVKPIDDQLPHDAFSVPKELLEPLQAKARAAGLWCLRSPAEYGGAGLNLLGQAVVAEESARCRMGAYIPACGAFGRDPPDVIFMGSQAQIERYGLPTMERERKAFVAISEASGGSDPARAIRCRATRKGDKYVINGSKMWITDAGNCDWGILFARAGEQGDRGGISCFIIDSDTPDISFKRIPVIRSYSPYEIHFDNAEIPAENLLGEEGQGFKVAEKWLIEGRVSYAANVVGTGQAALELAIGWAMQRETFGSKLSQKQAIQWMIADSEMELQAARLLVYQSAWAGDLGRDLKIPSSIAKVVASETAGRVVDRAIQIFGGLGLSQEMPWSAGTANFGSSASARAVRGAPHGRRARPVRAVGLRAEEQSQCRSISSSTGRASPPSRSTGRNGAMRWTPSTMRRCPTPGSVYATSPKCAAPS